MSSRASGQRQVVEGLRPYVGRLRTSNFALSVEGQETDGRERRGPSRTGPGLGTPLWLCLSMAHGTDQRSAEQGLLAAVLWSGPGSALPRQTQLRRVKVGQTEAVTRRTFTNLSATCTSSTPRPASPFLSHEWLFPSVWVLVSPRTQQSSQEACPGLGSLASQTPDVPAFVVTLKRIGPEASWTCSVTGMRQKAACPP